MHKAVRALIPLTAAAATPLLFAVPAHADGSNYQATLNSINGSGGSGTIMISLNGNSGTITENWSGLAAKFGDGAYPHVQHIHGGAAGQCPSTSADKNGDGVISTTEGASAYGGILTTLSTSGDTSPAAGTNIKIAPGGSSTNYSRTIQLSADSVKALQDGTAVVVVHGLDPAKLSKKAQGEKSDLVPSLPLAATSPALCGVVTAMPSGGVATGTGSTAGTEDGGLLALGGGSLAAAAGIALYAVRRRRTAAA